jgi:hypothetical protein
MKRVLASAVIAATLTIFGGTAAAAPSPTPNGWIGACNMNVSWPGLGVQNPNGVGVQPGGGMERAMTVDNPNGNAGMIHATDVSGDQDC